MADGTGYMVQSAEVLTVNRSIPSHLLQKSLLRLKIQILDHVDKDWKAVA